MVRVQTHTVAILAQAGIHCLAWAYRNGDGSKVYVVVCQLLNANIEIKRKKSWRDF